MKRVKSVLKPILRWVILGGALFFLGAVLRRHWQGVVAIRVDGAGWACLAIALGLTLAAHICAGWVWRRILYEFKQPVQGIAVIQAYLQTTIAKYLPGNVWHYYGRVTAATAAGASLTAATISVLLEPLLMAAAALLVTLFCSQRIAFYYGWPILIAQWASFGIVLGVIHPQVLNPLLQRLNRMQQRAKPADPIASVGPSFGMEHYPWIPFLGELGFLLLRGMGFLLTFQAISQVEGEQVPLLLGAFSLAWLLGLVVPGAPGGIGVFEATAVALLGTTFAPGTLLSIVALYRLISVLAEAIAAGLATLDQRLWI